MTDSTGKLQADLGANGPVFRHACDVLGRLYLQVEDEPGVQVRFREWQSRTSASRRAPVGDEGLFVVHTYLATLARLVALHHIRPNTFLPSRDDYVKVISGDYFRERDIYNFVEDDFFTWGLNPKALDDFLELAERLMDALTAYDLTGAGGRDLLKTLYYEMEHPESMRYRGEGHTPDRLARRILSEELRIKDAPDLSVFDPACGPGTFLSTAIHLITEGMAGRGEDEFDTLLHVLNSVMGIDMNPLAVTVARASYLLALGDLVSGPHPPVLVPVYLDDPIRVPDAGTSESLHIVQTTEPGVAFEIPDSLVDDPAQLDWIFHRMAQYLHAAEFRANVEGEERATEEVINSLYAYLTSPKRAGLRELPPLSSFDAGVLCRTARSLIKLVLEGKDTLWLHILKNDPATIYLSRRKFDLVVSSPPRLSTEQSNQFFATSADLYLRDGGSIAFVMPRGVAATAGGGSLPGLEPDKTLELEDYSVWVARRGEVAG
ncbi:MAG: hypothetical protein J4F46_09180 [Dehalococcoidia bacterium]|nr:hypothetical protein [Dehalococcoidia bacterium]